MRVRHAKKTFPADVLSVLKEKVGDVTPRNMRASFHNICFQLRAAGLQLTESQVIEYAEKWKQEHKAQ